MQTVKRYLDGPVRHLRAANQLPDRSARDGEVALYAHAVAQRRGYGPPGAGTAGGVELTLTKAGGLN